MVSKSHTIGKEARVTLQVDSDRLTPAMKKPALVLAVVLFVLLPVVAQDAGTSRPAPNFPDPAGGSSLPERKKALLDALRSGGDVDRRIIDALSAVPREQFLPSYLRNLAYEDSSLPLGNGQAVPAPSDFVRIAQAFGLTPADRLLIYGNSTGYVSALFSRLVAAVSDIELSPGNQAANDRIFAALGLTNITDVTSTAADALSSAGPFDKILVHGAVQGIPPGLLAQLKPGGRLIVPLTDPSGLQMLVMVERSSPTITISSVGKCFFPLLQLTAGNSG